MPISPDTTMSFAQTYIFASTVRSKLTKQASNPNSSLRVLVTQANMLDNVMDHLAEETEKRVTKNVSFSTAEDDHKHVSFQLPERKRHQGISTNVTEYEVGSESDSDSDSDSYSDDDDQSDSDSDYYYSSDDEEEETQVPSIQIAKVQSFKQLPCMDLSKYSIEEENEEDVEDEEEEEEIPELSRSISLTDDENLSLSDDEDLDESNYTYATDSGYPAYHSQDRKSEDSSEQHNLIITRSSDHYDAGHNSSPNTYAIENIF